MKVEKVPDSTYEMIGGCDKQIKEIKEVVELPIKHPQLFEAFGIQQPKGVFIIRSAGNRENALSPSRGASYGLYVYPGFRIGISTEVYWRRESIGEGVICNG